ncbi:MAG: DUF2934 domain-containing protein [Deltaproteobacteria bacterium]
MATNNKETTPKKTAAKKAAAPKTPRKRSASANKSIHDKIAKKAYELYEQSGRIDGKDVEHWLQAEKMVSSGKKKNKDSNS